MATILVIIAHPDDEILGCGGTMARHVDQGDTVYVTSMTDGVGARPNTDRATIERRQKAAQEAAKIIGFQWLNMGVFPDNQLDTVPFLDLVQFVETVKRNATPDLVYTHSKADLNIDHRLVTKAVLTAFRPQPGEPCREIRSMEIPSASDYGHPSVTGSFLPNVYVGIEHVWPRKQMALQAYADEIREAPHTRSLDGLKTLAKYRGMTKGIPMAETFQILWKIEE